VVLLGELLLNADVYAPLRGIYENLKNIKTQKDNSELSELLELSPLVLPMEELLFITYYLLLKKGVIAISLSDGEGSLIHFSTAPTKLCIVHYELCIIKGCPGLVTSLQALCNLVTSTL
jgi:hypothetical protein